MKKSKRLIFLIIYMLFLISIPCISNAANTTYNYNYNYNFNTYTYDYTIEDYKIDMVVNEDNSFDITETITANFNKAKHGIFRKIPIRNSVKRADGTKSDNKAKISKISVNDKYTTSTEDGYKEIKIGDKDKTVRGKRTYTIKYNYNIGRDPLKDVDELYFNLIGTEWDTTIKNVDFKITMPKEFDSSLLGMSRGKYGSGDSTNITYEVSGNVIEGKIDKALSKGEALTIRLTLPEGYFSAKSNFDILPIGIMIFSIGCVVGTYLLWRKYGKDDKVVETVEFYPPDGYNSAEVGFLYKGMADNKAIISLLVYLADKGYLKIEETDEKGMFSKNKGYKITKVKDYDGNNEAERVFFNGLFKKKDTVTHKDLYNKFYTTIDSVRSKIQSKANMYKIFEEVSSKKTIWVILMIVAIIAAMIIKPIIEYGPIGGTLTAVMYMVCIASIIALIVFACIMKKRTDYGNEMLGKIRGFKKFLENAEKGKLESLVEENPKYFYNILPYTYALGVSEKWMKQFESMAIEEPDWYVGNGAFNIIAFNTFMNNTMRSAETSMSSSPSSSGGSGGGFSGGGSGGGGGGSW